MGKCVYFELYHLENFILKLSLSIEKSCMYVYLNPPPPPPPIKLLIYYEKTFNFFISNRKRLTEVEITEARSETTQSYDVAEVHW